jgi:hypothetical protein
VFTRLAGSLILVKTLVQIGFAFGVGEGLSGFELLANGALGFAFELVAAVKQVLKLMKLVTHPKSILTSGLVASLQAHPPIGGHAKTVKAMGSEVVKMRFPRLGRAIGSQLDLEDGGALRINRDQDGGSDGKNLIAEIKHHFLVGHRERGRDRAPIVLEGFTEIAHGVGLIVKVLEDRGEARNRAVTFQT